MEHVVLPNCYEEGEVVYVLTADSMGKVFVNNPSWFSFGQAQPFENIKCPVVTAGTAFLYFV